MADVGLVLPPSFRFHPSDEEIITKYLAKKAGNPGFGAIGIAEADLNKSEPWELPSMVMGDNYEWYFFVKKDRRYPTPTGMKTKRATKAGFWKSTGKGLMKIYDGRGSLLGKKKHLVFYLGRELDANGKKTNWVMHEYVLEGQEGDSGNWTVCKLLHKNTVVKRGPNLRPSSSSVNENDEVANLLQMGIEELPMGMEELPIGMEELGMEELPMGMEELGIEELPMGMEELGIEELPMGMEELGMEELPMGMEELPSQANEDLSDLKEFENFWDNTEI